MSPNITYLPSTNKIPFFKVTYALLPFLEENGNKSIRPKEQLHFLKTVAYWREMDGWFS